MTGMFSVRDKPTLMESYLHADPETIKKVVLNPTMRLATI
jgi:hypothetical protein